MYDKKLLSYISRKKLKCSSQQLLIKPGRYIGDCKSANVDRSDYKKKNCVSSRTNQYLFRSMDIYLQLADNFVAA